MKRTFDKCSSTPFLYSSSTQLFISCERARASPLRSYDSSDPSISLDDDEESYKVKGGYAGKNGLMGCSIYAGMTQNKDSALAKVAKTVC
jgi:GH18 family chitinase